MVVRNTSSLSRYVQADAIRIEHFGAELCEHSVLKLKVGTAFAFTLGIRQRAEMGTFQQLSVIDPSKHAHAGGPWLRLLHLNP